MAHLHSILPMSDLAHPTKRKRSLSESPEADVGSGKLMNGSNGNSIIVKDKVTSRHQPSSPPVLIQNPQQKQKACLNCRRSKVSCANRYAIQLPHSALSPLQLKCVVSADGGACVRCATRKEECRFKTRAHVWFAHYSKLCTLLICPSGR